MTTYWRRTQQHAAANQASAALAAELYDAARAVAPPSENFLRDWNDKANLYIRKKIFRDCDLASALGSCAIMNVAHGGQWPEIIGRNVYEWLIEERTAQLGHPDRRQVAQACLWFDWECPFETPEESVTISGAEISIREAFAKAGLQADLQSAEIHNLKHKVDISFSHSKQPLFLELDGPSHFILKVDEHENLFPERYNNSTLFQTALITKLAAHAVLVRVPFPVQQMILDVTAELQKQFLLTLLKQANIKEPGAYHVRFDQNAYPVILPLTPEL